MTPTLTPTRTTHRQHADAARIPADPLRAFIDTCLGRKQTPLQIIDAVKDTFGIEIDYGQVIPCWKGEITIPTQTEHRPDKESVQFAADEPKEPLFTRMADGEAAPVLFSIAPESAISNVPDPVPGGSDADDAPTTQTGRRQDEKTKSILTDEVKAFIVRGLARYETPTRVAASVAANFGIEIDRRQVFAYDPAGSRPPAQRWIDLHAATRAKFLRAAAFLVQAAKECGGFYERFARPKRDAAPIAA